jgi:hypothetical protein
MEPLQIVKRLEDIEADLEARQAPFEIAAGDCHRLARDYELRLARVSLQTRADTATEKKWRAIDAVAEGRYEALKAAVRVLEQRATIGMALLKAASR